MTPTHVPTHKRANHVTSTAGVIHPKRTDVREVLHAVARSEVAWGRFVRFGGETYEREWECANDRVTRLVVLLATQEERTR